MALIALAQATQDLANKEEIADNFDLLRHSRQARIEEARLNAWRAVQTMASSIPEIDPSAGAISCIQFAMCYLPVAQLCNILCHACNESCHATWIHILRTSARSEIFDACMTVVPENICQRARQLTDEYIYMLST